MGEARLTDTDYSKDWPSYLQKASNTARKLEKTHQPVIVRMSTRTSRKELEGLVATAGVTEIIDNYDEQLGELFISKNAHLYKANHSVKKSSIADYLKSHYSTRKPWEMGSWVYYPWTGQLVHVLEEELFVELRTVRNKDLITKEEQKAFRELNVGCAGMSVGSNGAIGIVIQGGSQKIKLADGAVISGSNLNRIITGVASVGLEKSLVISRQLYEMNPYIEIQRLRKLDPTNIQDFFENWPLDLVVDEIDDLPTKILLRLEARKRRLPVIMVTEPGDDIMLDVERFDLDANLPLFHGLAGEIEELQNKKDINQREFMKYAMRIIGVKNTPLRAQESLMKVGVSLPTHPQLGGTAMFAGAAIAFAARQIGINGPLKNGRHTMSFEKQFLQGHSGLSHGIKHRRHTRMMTRAMRQV